MKKKILAIAVLVIYSLLFCMPAFAAEEDISAPAVPEKFIIGAENFALSEEELQNLNAQAKALYDAYGMEFYIARDPAASGDLAVYSADCYTNNSAGGDGLVLVIGAEQAYIYTTERITAMLSDTTIDDLWSAFKAGETDAASIANFYTAVGEFLASRAIPENRLLPRVVDNAGLLNNREEEKLNELLDEISERQQFDVVVVTVMSTDGKDVMDYADDFYDYNGYGYGSENDGTLLLVDMGGREWWITTTGYGITALTDAGIDYIGEQFQPYLSDEEYYKGFERFANLCDEFVTQARTGEPYDRDNLPKKPVSWLWIPGSMLLGALPSGIVSNNMKSKLKTVRSKSEADSYVEGGATTITRRNDVFLYRNVSRSAIVDSSSRSGGGGSSTHFSSSGTSHGGGGGRF